MNPVPTMRSSRAYRSGEAQHSGGVQIPGPSWQQRGLPGAYVGYGTQVSGDWCMLAEETAEVPKHMQAVEERSASLPKMQATRQLGKSQMLATSRLFARIYQPRGPACHVISHAIL